MLVGRWVGLAQRAASRDGADRSGFSGHGQAAVHDGDASQLEILRAQLL